MSYSSLSAVVPGSYASISRDIFHRCCKALEENQMCFIYKLERDLSYAQLDAIFSAIPTGPLHKVTYSALNSDRDIIIVQINNV